MRRGGKHSERGLEVLMLRRGSEARFMPGVWVFAGGVVEEADLAAAANARWTSRHPQTAAGVGARLSRPKLIEMPQTGQMLPLDASR